MALSKLVEKEKAIDLRRQGYSYDEILKIVPVSISSLSLWLRKIKLSEKQKSRLREKIVECHKKAWVICRQNRISRTERVKEIARNEVGDLSQRDLWLIGIALYWAEGAKQKEYNTGEQVSFSNSDPDMVSLFLSWVYRCLQLGRDDIVCSLYIHENAKNRVEKVKEFWAGHLNIQNDAISTYFKKHTVNPYRKNQGEKYMGLIRIRVRKSAWINRRISGWIEGISQ
ncbi:MAG: hypothetical protein Q7S47_02775 [bacterium]|nr:hypothetical protein [bacterium]